MRLKDFFIEDLTYNISVSTVLLPTPAKSQALRTHINMFHLHFKGFIPSVAQRSVHCMNQHQFMTGSCFFSYSR